MMQQSLSPILAADIPLSRVSYVVAIVDMIRQDERTQTRTSENIKKITLDIVTSIIESFIRNPTTASYLNENGLWGELTNPKLWPLSQVTENKSILTTLARHDVQPESVVLANGFDREARENSVFELEKRFVLDKDQVEEFAADPDEAISELDKAL